MKAPRSWLVVVLLPLLALIAALELVALIWVVRGQANRNETAVTALCAQRDDLDQQIAVTERLLHPEAIRQIAQRRRARAQARRLFTTIPRELIVDGQKRSRVTRHNLEILDC